MNRRPTLTQLLDWAETTMPGDESRARSVFQQARKNELFLTGGRGRHAPFMGGTDFATAILSVLHVGKVTEAGKDIQELWRLPLDFIEIDDPDRVQNSQFSHNRISKDGFEAPYIRQFGLDLWHPSNLIGILTILLEHYRERGKEFQPTDRIELHASGGKICVEVALSAGSPVSVSGWRNGGPENSSLTATYGTDTIWRHGPYLRQSRSIYGDALNALLKVSRDSGGRK